MSGYDATADPELELLGLLAEELVAGEVPASVLPGDDEIPAQLVVALEGDDVSATVHVCFLPVLDEPPVLQYIVALDVEVALDAVDTTGRLLHLINTSLPLPGFELSETAQAVVFRHVQAIAVRPLDPGVVAWPLSMIFHAVTRFEPVIREACRGTDYRDLVAAYARAQAAVFAPEADAHA